MPRIPCADIHELFWFSVVLAIGAALLDSTNPALWTFVLCLSMHAIYQTKSTPLMVVMLAPYVLLTPFQAAQWMAAAAYWFFFVAIETKPTTEGTTSAATAASTATCTEAPVVNPVADV